MNTRQTIQPHNPLESPEKPTMTIDLHQGSNEQVSIVIVHHNRPEFLSMCLQSIHVMSNMNNYEVIVVDNASDDQDSKDYLAAVEQEGVKVIRSRENLYWSAAANRGASMADKNSKYLFFMHADTVVLQPNWIDTMIQLAESKAGGLVGNQMLHYYIMRNKIDYVAEWCVMFTRECWNDCGPWPEELPLIGNAFIMTIRAATRGYRPLACNNNLVHHFRAISYDPNDYEQLADKAMATVPKLLHQAQSAS